MCVILKTRQQFIKKKKKETQRKIKARQNMLQLNIQIYKCTFNKYKMKGSFRNPDFPKFPKSSLIFLLISTAFDLDGRHRSEVNGPGRGTVSEQRREVGSISRDRKADLSKQCPRGTALSYTNIQMVAAIKWPVTKRGRRKRGGANGPVLTLTSLIKHKTD